MLYESASGYALMEVTEAEEVGSLLEEVQQAVLDPQRFCRTVKLKGFQPFTSAENALENVNAISEQMVTEDLKVRHEDFVMVPYITVVGRVPRPGLVAQTVPLTKCVLGESAAMSVVRF